MKNQRFMAVLGIVTEPNPKLRIRSDEVSTIDDELLKFMDDMLETMYHAKGIGLAAVQVGVHKRISVIDLKELDDENRPDGFFPLFLINTKITYLSDSKTAAEEGCLSVPGHGVKVERMEGVSVKYLDRHGKPSSFTSTGWLARVVQHEQDHLDGKLILDYLSKIKKDMVMRKLSRHKY